MGLQKLTVCTQKGQISGKDESAQDVEGTIAPDGLYRFYAGTPSEDGQYIIETDSEGKIKPHAITVILPVGGSVSGLYRFPRVGEQVLVDSASSSGTSIYYLLGYVPSENENEGTSFTPDASDLEKNKLLQENQGMVLRYQQTGKNADKAGVDEKYSEIGFYRQPTSWKAKRETDYNEFDTQDGVKFPKIDRINIQSTGDIRSKAKNYHEINAKRLEILAGLDSYDHAKDDKNLPLGDMPGDDPALYAGDAHIRAKNRIIIKAGDEITLQVGRSAITISDSGITLSSKKVKGNFFNPWDTVISLTPRDGVDIFGQHLNMTGAFDFSLNDQMGAGISSFGSALRISAKDVKIKTITLFLTIAKQLMMLSQFGITLDAMRSGMLSEHHDDVGTASDSSRKYSNTAINKIVPLVFKILNAKFGSKPGSGESKDPLTKFLGVWELLVSLNSMACTVLAEKMRTKEQLKKDIRDQINLAQLVVEFALTESAAVILIPAWGGGLTHSAELLLAGNANLYGTGFIGDWDFVEQKDVRAPLAGFVDSAAKWAKDIWGGFGGAKWPLAIVAALAVGLPVGSAVLGLGKMSTEHAILSRFDATKKADQEALEALKEL